MSNIGLLQYIYIICYSRALSSLKERTRPVTLPEMDDSSKGDKQGSGVNDRDRYLKQATPLGPQRKEARHKKSQS